MNAPFEKFKVTHVWYSHRQYRVSVWPTCASLIEAGDTAESAINLHDVQTNFIEEAIREKLEREREKT